MIKMKKIIVNLVHGSNGYSLQIVDKDGCGKRISGSKAWGNPCNKPTASFTIDSEELIKAINSFSFEEA